MISLKELSDASAITAMILAAEKIEDDSPVNAGRDDRITMNQAADLVFEISDWKPKTLQHDTTKPQGVASRAADLTRARRVLGWEPEVSYRDGFKKTIDWYFSSKNREEIRKSLSKILFERAA